VAPDVSFLVACFNARAYLAEAVASALAQRDVTVEVLIVDDHSTDDSWRLVQHLAAADGRVRALRTPANMGPAGARNVAIEAARGRWLAILDSDDILESVRSRRLIDAADEVRADVVADDLMVFTDGALEASRRFLGGSPGQSGWIDLERYLAGTRMFGRSPDLGFLKPMIRADFLRRHRVTYDETLRIAEDDALIVRLLRSGARYLLVQEPLYRYRKHEGSISHRLSADHVDRMMAAGEKLREELRGNEAAARALAPRHRALRRAWAFTHLIDALKARDPLRAVAIAAAHPTMLPLLRMPASAALERLFRQPQRGGGSRSSRQART
jgi:succinoglycan biosynthesis protein ExoO